ncbi:MAG: uroporphyrinogen decarboxylase [candidate division Zixibacteria bacterium]|nr:uroporphyrinogen decarboxylase [candidate division Zixibacteria bacterium]
MVPLIGDSSFIKACYGKNEGRLPVWVMRQAGRYLAEYRAVRKNVSFLELCKTPELVAKVTTDPVNKFGFDAAILFSDILPILEPMGFTVTYESGGPTVAPAIRRPEMVNELSAYDVRDKMSYVFEGVRAIKKRIPDVPLLGFAGSPFTLACYAIEGHGSKTFDSVKQFMYCHPKESAQLLEAITEVTIVYLQEQVKAGADAVQLFDSWSGILAVNEYREWSLVYSEKIFKALKSLSVPRILFVNNVSPYIHLLRDIDCEVIGVDYRMDLELAMNELPGKAVQGNLDPNILYCPQAEIRERVRAMLGNLTRLDNVIVNLGHGILPDIPEESVATFVDEVHAFRREV